MCNTQRKEECGRGETAIRSLGGIEAGATGFLKSRLGGFAIFSVVKDATASFVVSKVLDSIEGKGHSVPLVGFIPVVGKFLDPLLRAHLCRGNI